MTGTEPRRLLSRGFIAVNFICFLSAAVMANFFHFQHYLRELSVPPGWFGFLIGADSLASFVLQPVLAVRLNGRNGRRWIVISLAGMAASLFLYSFAFSPAALAAVRIIHGAAFVCLFSALMATMTLYIPREKSGQAFGLVSVVRLLPYSIIPPVVSMVVEKPSHFRHVLVAWGAVMLLTALVAPLFAPPPSKSKGTAGPGPDATREATGRDLLGILKDRKMATLFAAQLMLYSSYTIIFFFLKEYAAGKGIENPGFFFTIATLAMIGVRIVGSAFFDRFSKAAQAGISMAGLAACYFALGAFSRPGTFHLLALLTGIGWGVAIPVVTALVFDMSEPRLRAMNLNLSLLVLQGGFFVGPLAGGALIVHGGYGLLLNFTVAITLAAAGLMWTLVRGERT